MNIIFALLIFSTIVIIHELGHFWLARLNGVKVLEFSLGMGPRLYTYHGKETDYSIKLLPLGGSCQMLGEDEVSDHVEEAYSSKKAWQRFLIVIAGPMFNFLLAFIFAFIIIANIGIDKPMISGVSAGYPAEAAGLQAGDVITKIDGKRMDIYRDITLYLYLHSDKELEVEVLREENGTKQRHTFAIRPQYSEEYGRYMLGIISSERERTNPMETALYAIKEVSFNIKSTILSLSMLVGGRVSANEISGPVGIVGMIGDTVNESAAYGLRILFLSVANLIVLLSSNLGVMNLLPIPALDGGRILFILVEMITRKELNKNVEAYIHLAGFVLLMSFMIFIIFNDIRNLIF